MRVDVDRFVSLTSCQRLSLGYHVHTVGVRLEGLGLWFYSLLGHSSHGSEAGP